MKKCVSLFESATLIVSFFAIAYFLSFGATPVLANTEADGCCSLNSAGQQCLTTNASSCTGTFASGALCAETSFCRKGCCYNESLGVYDKNALEANCDATWGDDANCNYEGATLGCCILGSITSYETEGQCRVDTLSRALTNDGSYNWSNRHNELGCAVLAGAQEEGACVLSDGGCDFGTQSECSSSGGVFAKNVLCTSDALNTTCKSTQDTSCVDGKDQVYFIDSCGNRANIYDADLVDNTEYWDKVVSVADSCGVNNDSGNANNTDCGNCDRFAGGICASAVGDSFDVAVGNYYCRDTSCVYDDKIYENGESWCAYDGVIGNGDDVVGSRHWKYVCNQGSVTVEPCADYRNEICVQNVAQSDESFLNAACIANPSRTCLNMNSKEYSLEDCSKESYCRVENIRIGDQFHFDVCLPEYPAGFSFDSVRYTSTAKTLCSTASMECTVIRQANKWGDCEVVKNAGCLGAGFAQQMNEFCTGIGDCGGSVNIIGDFSDSYSVSGAPGLARLWIESLIELASPIEGQYAEVGDVTKYLEASGMLGTSDLGGLGNEDEADEGGFSVTSLSTGLSGISLAASLATTGKMFGFTVLKSGGLSFLHGGIEAGTGAVSLTSTGAAISAIGNAAMGLSAGMMVGSLLAKQLDLSEGGSMMMSVGGAMVGAAVSIGMMKIKALALFAPYLAVIGLALMIFASFLGMSKCDPIYVNFDCKPWRPIPGSSSCEICNNDTMKPCSKYRCKSLGANCEFINDGTDDEMCASAVDDGLSPLISSLDSLSSDNAHIDKESGGGFGIASVDNNCLDAYDQIMFSVATSELAYCKFDIKAVSFDNMTYDFGASSYTINHSVAFTLPDPSAGQSQGYDWHGDLTLYVQCQDRFGFLSSDGYKIELCVNEGEDVTAPRIVSFSPKNNSIISYDADNIELEVVTNEFARCRWDTVDGDYLQLGHAMNCSDTYSKPSNVYGYSCNDVLDISNGTQTYYINCEDQPWLAEGVGNSRLSSYEYSIRKPSKKIHIDFIEPDKDIEIGTTYATIELEIKTSGGGGSHHCLYSFSGYETMIELFETGSSTLHTQSLNLPEGKHVVYVECRDETGDFAKNQSRFEIIQDVSSPEIARIWQAGSILHIWTTSSADCEYSKDGCGFIIGDGIGIGSGEEHKISSTKEGQTYYVKCKDEFGNTPSGCSLEIEAT